MSDFAITRRKFAQGLMFTGGMMVLSRRASPATFALRQYHNQPTDSPLHKRLVEMWAAVKTETAGRIQAEIFPENNHFVQGDPDPLGMLVRGELDFFTLSGGGIAALVPAANVQAVPFAFRTPAQVYSTLDGDLGSYLREEIKAKGIYAVPRACFENGFHQITCSTRPVRTADDLQGLKIRTPGASLYMDFWKGLGALPVSININKLYEGLKSGAAEAQEDPLDIAELFRLYEVQKYVSLTNHSWSGFNLIANLKLWQSLPEDVQGVIERNAAKFAHLQRVDNDTLNVKLRTQLTQQGMLFNETDIPSFRARLGSLYTSWKDSVGQQAWKLLESHVGKLR